VDQDGFVLDIPVQSRHDKKAAKRLLRYRAPAAQGAEQQGGELAPADPTRTADEAFQVSQTGAAFSRHA
jgi:hypothetical protein